MTIAKLRKMLTHPRKNESGQGALAMVLLLLMLGAVILTPLLVFMSTGLKAGQVYESKLQEFYAADAGVEDAIWNITGGNLIMPANYTLADNVNDRNVSVTIQEITGGVYKINSTATSDSGGNTTIECYYGALDYSSLLDNAITTNGTVIIKKGVNVTGNISAPDCTDVEDCDYAGCPNWTCCVYPNCTKCCSNESLSWPSAETLSAYYYNKTKDYPYSGEDINIAENPERGPLYKNGMLDIYNGGSAGKNATLNGTVYVTGNTKIGSTTGTSRSFTLNLNNQTIFVESNTTGAPYAIWVDKNVQIIGSGCIIAVGDVYFAPDGDVGSPGDFVLIMSVTGTVTLRPSGTFYGAIVGKDTVMEQSGVNASITSTGYSEGIDFPIGQTEKKVLSYTIK